MRDRCAMKDLLQELAPKLGLPTQQRDGQRIVYTLYHEQSGNTLSYNETLSDAGVVKNDTCLILREPASGDTEQAEPEARILTQAEPKPEVKQKQLLQKTSEKNKEEFPWENLFEIGIFLVYVIPGGLLGGLVGDLTGRVLIGSIVGIVMGVIIWFWREIS